MRFSAFPLAASIASATPVLRGTYSSSNTAVACGGTGLQPLADCTVEHSSSALMPVNDFALILEANAGSRLSTGTGKKAIHDFSGPLGSAPAHNFKVTCNAPPRCLAYTVSGLTSGAAMKIGDLIADGMSMGVPQSLAQQTIITKQFYYVSGVNNSFNRSGKVTMAWPTEGTAPSRTNTLDYMKSGVACGAPPPPPTVADPAHFAMLGIGLAAPGAVHRSKRS